MAFLRAFFIFSFIFTVFLPAEASAAGFWDAFVKVFQSDVIEESGPAQQDPIPPRATAFLGAAFLPATASASGSTDQDTKNDLTAPDLSIVQNSTLVSPTNPQGIFSDDIRGSIATYTVKEGDNLSAIAQSFGITVNTLLWANDIKNVRSIKPGDTLVILPVSGVKYTVKNGDTIGSIAKKFKPKDADLAGFTADLLGFNGLAVDEQLAVGTDIIIPDGEFQEAPSPTPTQGGGGAPARFAALPEYIGYYLRPILGGRNSRATRTNPHGIHGFNGVDLATTCGDSIMASAQGTIIIARSNGWNGGYGRYVVIAHPNGTQTLYGHMHVVEVSVGQAVVQGQEIGKIGSTGNSTGCHVHFEIRGAKNPF